jgi:putative redox protein
MRAVARRVEGFAHQVEVDGHKLVVDEPTEEGGTDTGPSPTRLLTASLASCTAITVVMYTDRKGWDVGQLEVSAEFERAPKRGETARFDVTIRLPAALTDEQVERIEVVAGKCPVHRTLIGEVEVNDRIERV